MSHLSVIRNLWELFLNKNAEFKGEQEKGSIIRVGIGKEFSFPWDHCLSSPSKPRDANH